MKKTLITAAIAAAALAPAAVMAQAAAPAAAPAASATATANPTTGAKVFDAAGAEVGTVEASRATSSPSPPALPAPVFPRTPS